MTPEQARDEYDKLAPEAQANVRHMIKSGRDRVAAVESVAGQNAAYESEQPTDDENSKARLLGATTGLFPPLNVTDALNPAGVVVGAHRSLLRKLTGYDDAEKKAIDKAPAAFNEGEIGSQVAQLALGAGAGAVGVAGRAARSAAKAAASGPLAARASGAAKVAAGEVAQRVPFAKSLKTLFGRGGEVTDDMIVANDAAPPAEATSSPVPQIGKTELRRILDELKAGDAKAPVIDLAAKPPAFPVGEGDAARAARINAQADDLVAKLGASKKVDPLIGTRESRANPGPPTVRQRTPTPALEPVDARAAAVERVTTEEGLPGRGEHEHGPIPSLEELRAMFPNPEVPGSAARAAWEAMPLVPQPGAAGAPLSSQALKAAAKEAVANGESLAALARRLGIPQGDIAAAFKGAQLGY